MDDAGAQAGGFTVETVRAARQRRLDARRCWTAIERQGAAPLALASISSVHWSDGGMVDLGRVAAGAARAGRGPADRRHAQRRRDADLDVRALDPDFVVFPTYKWLLGPYGRAFLYVAKRHQGGVPLEQTSYGRRAVRAEQDIYFTRHRLRRRRAALRHGRARPLHLDGDGRRSAWR